MHVLTHVSTLCLVAATMSVGTYPIGNGEFFCPSLSSDACYTITCTTDEIGSGSGEMGSGSGELGSGSGFGSGDLIGSDGVGSGSGSGDVGSGSEASPSPFCAPSAQFLPAVPAGFVCSRGDLNSAHGNTEAHCSDAGGTWFPYDCQDVANHIAALPESESSGAKGFWQGMCCSGGDLGSRVCTAPARFLASATASYGCDRGRFNISEAECSVANGTWGAYTCSIIALYAASSPELERGLIQASVQRRCCTVGGDVGSGDTGSGSGELGSGSGEGSGDLIGSDGAGSGSGSGETGSGSGELGSGSGDISSGSGTGSGDVIGDGDLFCSRFARGEDVAYCNGGGGDGYASDKRSPYPAEQPCQVLGMRDGELAFECEYISGASGVYFCPGVNAGHCDSRQSAEQRQRFWSAGCSSMCALGDVGSGAEAPPPPPLSPPPTPGTQVQLVESYYTGDSCSGEPAVSMALPASTCIAVPMEYRRVWWGTDSRSAFSASFQTGSMLQWCIGSTQTACDAAVRNVTIRYSAAVERGETSLADADYPDSSMVECGEWGPISLADSTCLTGQTLCGTDTMNDTECGCRLSGCRASLSLTLVPPPSSPVWITESLYSGGGSVGQIGKYGSGEASSGSSAFGSVSGEIGSGDGAGCTGDPELTFTTVSGTCELTSSAYREAWWGSDEAHSDGYSVNDTRLTYAGFMRHSGDQIAFCWGATKYACESGFASTPLTKDHDWFETSTQICGDDGLFYDEMISAGATVGVCTADSGAADGGWCTLTNCVFQYTIAYPSPSLPPRSPPSPPLLPPLSAATATVRQWANASGLTETTDAPWPIVRATPSGCFKLAPGSDSFHIAVCDMASGLVWFRNFADSACTQLTWSSRGEHDPNGTCFSVALSWSHLGTRACRAYP